MLMLLHSQLHCLFNNLFQLTTHTFSSLFLQISYHQLDVSSVFVGQMPSVKMAAEISQNLVAFRLVNKIAWALPPMVINHPWPGNHSIRVDLGNIIDPGEIRQISHNPNCPYPHFSRSTCLKYFQPWWRHQMNTFSAWLALCAEISPVIGEFPSQRPITRSFDVLFEQTVE